MSNIILLNGSSSAGKSSVAKAIQYLSDVSWLHIGIDTFIDMIPRKFLDHYFSFEESSNDRGPLVNIKEYPLGHEFFVNTPSVVAALANITQYVIVDEVITDAPTLTSYAQHLTNHKVYFIGVLCSLEVMQEREYLRGNRAIGLANGYIDRVHWAKEYYDLEVDTTHTSSFNVACEILQFVEKTLEPKGFRSIVL